ncbi:MAG: hypothetical protein DRN81_04995 [Thermoproteota archaeon]|nr:MAG: hypothetical protein DRN81_04995 [Candidatus Korarchaeota archaeon]
MTVLRRLVAPVNMAVTLDEAKNHLKILSTETEDDALLTRVILAASEMLERECKLALITQTWGLYSDEFKEEFHIFKHPVQAVSSIQYYDINGVLQTVDATHYFVDNVSRPARIIFKGDYIFPDIEEYRPNGLVFTFTVGYGDDATDVSSEVRSCLLMMLSHWYENREAVVISNWSIHNLPFAVTKMIEQLDVVTFGSDTF